MAASQINGFLRPCKNTQYENAEQRCQGQANASHKPRLSALRQHQTQRTRKSGNDDNSDRGQGGSVNDGYGNLLASNTPHPTPTATEPSLAAGGSRGPSFISDLYATGGGGGSADCNHIGIAQGSAGTRGGDGWICVVFSS